MTIRFTKAGIPVVKLAISQISAPEISFPTAARSTTRNPGNGVDYLKYVNQGPLELFIRAAQMAQQHFEISPPSGSSRKSKEENGHRDDDSSNRPKHCFESRQSQWSTIQAGIPQAGNDDNQGGNRADTHRTDKNLKCPPQSLLHRMLRFGGGVNHRRCTPASLAGEHGAG